MQQGTYTPNKNQLIVVGQSALVDVVDHPTCPGMTVRTTAVKEYDEVTGIFITDNTVFTPIPQTPEVPAVPVVPASKVATIKEVSE